MVQNKAMGCPIKRHLPKSAHQNGQGWSTVGWKVFWLVIMLHGLAVLTVPEMCLAALGVFAAGDVAVLSWNRVSPTTKVRTVPSEVCTNLRCLAASACRLELALGQKNK